MRNVARVEAPHDGLSQKIPFDIGKVRAPRVLVVDDERLVRWAIAETLGDLGYVVIEAADARTALEVFGDDVDLVLLDLHLPDCSDLSVLTRMRRTAPSTPVILMTAFATPAAISEASAYGTPVVAKPFDLADLAARVQRTLPDRLY
jgi:DNA-binding response OmpR family regulator